MPWRGWGRTADEHSRQLTLNDLLERRELYDILVQHAYRGVRVQFLLRAVLVVFVLLVVIFVPPAHDRGACYLIAGSYAVWTIGVTLLARRGGELPIRYIWLALLADVGALAALTLVAAGNSNDQSWTADVALNGFFLIPMLAATQLRPWVCTVVSLPTLAVYVGASIATKHANVEPWASILLRSGVLGGLGVCCILLSYVQRSRVLTIATLVSERSDLLAELLTIGDRERRDLAENLHDGALQYVLAARQDLEDARDTGDAESFDRIELALRESSQLLRSTMTQLHPAVLEQSGLPYALRDLARSVAPRGDLDIQIRTDGWPDDLRTPADALLFASARELLTNVVKHAQASRVQVELAVVGRQARLTVADDGRGIAEGVVEQRLGEGHIGLASRRVRLEAAGGRLALLPVDPHGTRAEVELPLEASPAAATPAPGPMSDLAAERAL